ADQRHPVAGDTVEDRDQHVRAPFPDREMRREWALRHGISRFRIALSLSDCSMERKPMAWRMNTICLSSAAWRDLSASLRDHRAGLAPPALRYCANAARKSSVMRLQPAMATQSPPILSIHRRRKCCGKKRCTGQTAE